MGLRMITVFITPILLAACVDSDYRPVTSTVSAENSTNICQGFGCANTPGKLPSRPETHKPTKDEKIRARQGENPNFGSEEWRVSATFPIN